MTNFSKIKRAASIITCYHPSDDVASLALTRDTHFPSGLTSRGLAPTVVTIGMNTPPPIWDYTSRKYYDHFGEIRAAPPPDKAKTDSLHPYTLLSAACQTTTITQFKPATLDHALGQIHLNFDFVKDVVCHAGPVLVDNNRILWSFHTQPRSFRLHADTKMDYYLWFNWAICAPAADAVNAVCDELRAKTSGAACVPSLPGHSRSNINTSTTAGSAPNLTHSWVAADTADPKTLTVHEFKRAKVLRVGSQCTLNWLVLKAATESVYKFRAKILNGSMGDTTLARKAFGVVVNEMLTYDVGHAVIGTQEHYVLVCLTASHQLEVSPVYRIRGSTTQADDMTELVLFYSHAAICTGARYPHIATSLTIGRVTVLAFPTWIFQPYEGLFRKGTLGYRTKLVLGFDGEIRSNSNSVTVAVGYLALSFFAVRVVVKTSHAPFAAKRLNQEFAVYCTLCTLQGVVIPKLIGLYMTMDNKSTVLMMSYTGQALREFTELELSERRLLFRRLILLHRNGIRHNDLEPRNITKSRGASCDELLDVAEALDLDLAAELATFQETVPERPSSAYTTAVAFGRSLILAVCAFVLFT
ncbi:hypothetical protein C8R45DRAFT_937932 [Mycena sanguinolenta]|nr:hypothetical protein C8R45DRAFT_937932 [Mycena sanguinolenta]